MRPSDSCQCGPVEIKKEKVSRNGKRTFFLSAGIYPDFRGLCDRSGKCVEIPVHCRSVWRRGVCTDLCGISGAFRSSEICSGDSGVYGMAGLVLQMAEAYPDVNVEVIPGVTAALGGGAILGAPLGHDFAVISLSDLLTPMEVIEKRLRAAAEADFIICLYNPSSRKRHDYLERACRILLEYKSGETACGYVQNIGREGEAVHLLTLAELEKTPVDMFTTVFIGNKETQMLNGCLVTPRGYRDV